MDPSPDGGRALYLDMTLVRLRADTEVGAMKMGLRVLRRRQTWLRDGDFVWFDELGAAQRSVFSIGLFELQEQVDKTGRRLLCVEFRSLDARPIVNTPPCVQQVVIFSPNFRSPSEGVWGASFGQAMRGSPPLIHVYAFASNSKSSHVTGHVNLCFRLLQLHIKHLGEGPKRKSLR